jgi:elongation factor Ts
MSVTAAQVKELRVKTGAGMMDCKKALTETGGDFDKAVENLRKAGLAATNKKAGRIATEGLVGSYIHGNGKIGVMVEINCETDFVARNEDFQQFVRDVAMHVAAMNPQYLDRESVPADIVSKEKEILAAQIAEEGKPANIVEKIVEGRIGKFFSENCLMEQIFVKDTGDKKTLDAIQTDLVAKIGEKIRVRRFVRFELGEGMEKKNEDFAAEVAKTAGQAN